MRNPLIAIAVVLTAASLRAQTFEGAVQTGSAEIGAAAKAQKAEQAEAAKAAAKAAKEAEPCAENSQLDKAVFKVRIDAKTELTMSFKSCTPYYVNEAPHGRLDVSQAIRRYESAGTDYAFVVVTPLGSDKSELVLIKGVSYAAGGAAPTSSLAVAKTIDLNNKAAVTFVPPAPPVDYDVPNGRDCR